MSVSKQDWHDWRDKFWGDCHQPIEDLKAGLESALSSISGGDSATFLRLTGGDLRDLASAALNKVSPAYTALAALKLSGNQRRFALQPTIDTSDLAITRLMECLTIVNQVDTDLVRGVQLEHDAVEADSSALAGMDGSLSGRLRETLGRLNGSLASTDDAINNLVAITKIGRF